MWKKGLFEAKRIGRAVYIGLNTQYSLYVGFAPWVREWFYPQQSVETGGYGSNKFCCPKEKRFYLWVFSSISPDLLARIIRKYERFIHISHTLSTVFGELSTG